jgi:hypothetical protein
MCGCVPPLHVGAAYRTRDAKQGCKTTTQGNDGKQRWKTGRSDLSGTRRQPDACTPLCLTSPCVS